MKREERKKSCVCCCSPALEAEIRLINSRDNVEMSSMTSILGAEAHCAAFQPALCWVNGGSPGRKTLIDGSLQPPVSVHCWVSHTDPTHQQGGVLPARQQRTKRPGRWVDKYGDVSAVLRHWWSLTPLLRTTLTPGVFIGLWNKSERFCWDDSCGWLSGLPAGRLEFHWDLMILQQLSSSHWESVSARVWFQNESTQFKTRNSHLFL